MTLLLERPGDDPKTHAFVVGVGKYTHLSGGKHVIQENLGLGQLTSPPISARAFADWLVEELDNTNAPLGSVEMLVSPAGRYRSPQGVADVEVEAATMANVKQAFTRWKGSCNTHEGNVAIFYFCGHGVKKAGLALLLEDFGSNPDRLFENAIDFEATHEGMMSTCKAHIQCFFADACRQVPYRLLEMEVEATALCDRMFRRHLPADAPRFYATPPNNSAYGLAEEATFYTKALLQALRGTGSIRLRGKWRVTTGRLHEGIREAMRIAQRRHQAPKQRAQLGGEIRGDGALQILSNRPVVPVSITLDPPEAADHATLSLVSADDPKIRKTKIREAGDWELDLKAGKYNGAADFGRAAFRNGTWAVDVFPPSGEEVWPVGLSENG